MDNIVKLTRIESTHNNLKTESVEGACFDFPMVGESFTMYQGPLKNLTGMRVIMTSPIEWVKIVEGDYIFKTKNSLYELQVKSEGTEAEQQVEL